MEELKIEKPPEDDPYMDLFEKIHRHKPWKDYENLEEKIKKGEVKLELELWLEEYRIRLFEDFEMRADKTQTIGEFDKIRKIKMLKKNPKFVLRNHLLQHSIEKAEKGDYSMVNDLLKVVESPFEEHEDVPKEWSDVAPESSKNILVSCSS